MAAMLRPLRIFAQYRKPLVTSVSGSLAFSKTNDNGTTESNFLGHGHLDLEFSLRIEVKPTEARLQISLLLKGSDKESSSVADESPSANIESSSATKAQFSGLPPVSPKLANYRILDGYGTSFLWRKDPEYDPKDPSIYEDMDVDEINSTFPRIFPYFIIWVSSYEFSFSARGLDHGSGKSVFETVAEWVSWKVEGFLLGYLLAQEPGVEEVDFRVDSEGRYVLKKGRKVESEEVFMGFLEDASMLLPG